jgi:hypothetical protein
LSLSLSLIFILGSKERAIAKGKESKPHPFDAALVPGRNNDAGLHLSFGYTDVF